MGNPLPTVRSNLGHHTVRAYCRHCDHDAVLDLPSLMRAGLGDVALLRLNLRCAACGRRGHTVIVSGIHRGLDAVSP